MSNGQLLPEEQQERRMISVGIWWIEHKKVIKKVIAATVVVLSFFGFVYGAYSYVDYFLIDYVSERQDLVSIVSGAKSLRLANLRTAPLQLDFKKVSVFNLGDDKFDLYTEVTNPNDSWFLEFDYRFTYSEGETEMQTAHMLPGEEKPLVWYAVELTGAPSNVEIEVLDYRWQRINLHAFPDYEGWQEDRLRFEVSDVEYTPSINLDEGDFARTSFTVTNNTGFAYWSVNYYVRLFRGTSVAAVTSVSIDEFEPNETRIIEVNWFHSVPASAKADVVLDLNILEPDVYMPLQAGFSEEHQGFVPSR